jgi:hypothetical protein
MKKIALVVTCILFFGSIGIQAQGKKKSPSMTTEGKVGETMITINYHAPSVRDRVVFGELEEFGKVWRAGANDATTIEFSNDVKINGKELKAGKYAFFTTPMEKGAWPIIFNSEYKQWGAYKINPDLNVLKGEAKVTKIEPMEVLKYSISEGMIHLEWSTTRISFEVN